jgi:energy-coupling factor transporter transmembrane protein EcfT
MKQQLKYMYDKLFGRNGVLPAKMTYDRYKSNRYRLLNHNKNNFLVNLTSLLGLIALFVVVVAIVAAIIGLFFFAMPFLVWLMWKAVMHYFWATGPQRIIDPDFWYFCLAYYIVAFLFGGVRISIKTKN